jgi:hypothetical protein
MYNGRSLCVSYRLVAHVPVGSSCDFLVVVDNEVACVNCDLCGDTPCVWLVEKDRVIANDMAENGTPVTVVNSTRRKLAFRYMFRCINAGPGRQGVRKKLPECVENGVRELFPDLVYMGFKEK